MSLIFHSFFVLTCYVCNQLRYLCTFSLFSIFFFLFCFLFFSLSFVAIVSHCPYYPSSHASVKVREGSNYWGPLGYEALTSPKSSQSPDPGSASKRACMFKFRKRKDSKIPLCPGQKRWDFVLYFRELQKGGSQREEEKWSFSHNLQSLPREVRTSGLLIYFAPSGVKCRRYVRWTSAMRQPC